MKKNMMKIAVCAGILFSTMATQNVNATDFTVDLDGPLGNSGAGYITDFKTVYSDTDNTLSFSSRIQERRGKLANGFWLVLNGGGAANDPSNPKGHGDQLTILYGDHRSGRLTSYIYNGENNASSYSESGAFIESFTTEFSSTYSNGGGRWDGVSTFDFTIGLDLINDPAGKPDGWRGIKYAEEVGIWYHPFFASRGAITYDKNGLIKHFGVRYSGWFDSNGTPTTVAEPAALGLMMIGFAGLALYRRKR